MILGLVMLIMSSISATDTELARLVPNLSDYTTIEQLRSITDINAFTALGKAGVIAFKFALFAEVFIEAWLLIFKVLPHFIANAWRNRKQKTVHEVEMLNAIKMKIENDLRLTRRETKFWEKWKKKNSKNQKI